MIFFVAVAIAMQHQVSRLLLVLVAAIGLYGLVWYYNSAREGFGPAKKVRVDNLVHAGARREDEVARERFSAPTEAPRPVAAATAPLPRPMEDASTEKHLAPGGGGASHVSAPSVQDRISPEELLPSGAANTTWAQVNPAGQGDVKDQNFLTAGHHLGVNTQGSSLRNASHDLRHEPPNPRHVVSIWNMTTVEPDMNRRPLE